MCNEQKLKPLIINRPLCFKQSPGGACLRTFIEGMSTHIWRPVAYASDNGNLTDRIPDYVYLTHEIKYIRLVASVIRKCILPDLTFLPGYEWYSWGIGAKRRILNDIKLGAEFDYIHSVSFPCACHKVALDIKKKTGLPWVMQLYDPWADNPYRPFKSQFFKRIDWKQERECVEQADLIIHDNRAIADLWIQRYGDEIAKKIVVLPLTIPLPNVEVRNNTHKSGELLTISHIGNFMLNRTSQQFIHAVGNLLHMHPEYRDILRVNYIGSVTEAEKILIKMKGLNDIFNLAGSVSEEECIEYYIRSDVFLAIDGINKNNLFFPSKILKYFYFRRPILGITPHNSVLDIELKNSGHVSIENDDINSITNYLVRAITAYETLLNFNLDYWVNFLPSNVLLQYKQLINEMLNSY